MAQTTKNESPEPGDAPKTAEDPGGLRVHGNGPVNPNGPDDRTDQGDLVWTGENLDEVKAAIPKGRYEILDEDSIRVADQPHIHLRDKETGTDHYIYWGNFLQFNDDDSIVYGSR